MNLSDIAAEDYPTTELRLPDWLEGGKLVFLDSNKAEITDGDGNTVPVTLAKAKNLTSRSDWEHMSIPEPKPPV